MNIFATSRDWRRCAEDLDDKRLVKMILETAQILCTAMRLNGVREDIPYKSTHANHPCVKWAASENNTNFSWLTYYLEALHDEYSYRFGGRSHVSFLKVFPLAHRHCRLNPVEADVHPNCARNSSLGIEGCGDDVYESYRNYLTLRWKRDTRQPKWTLRGMPSWARSAWYPI